MTVKSDNKWLEIIAGLIEEGAGGVPTPPSEGEYVLTSTDGVISWEPTE